ncbi:GspH/FimT family pseudopilin [Acinetobacter junii]|uniref:GspH/FimT family pseudopilin n=1 Tax=Acinetobacter junii TaxID=40215 RepID=UPI003A8852D6
MKKIKAFTLVELLVTIAVLAILAMMAAPSMSQILHNSKVNSSSGDVLNFLQQSRSEAIRLGSAVTVCASSDGASCVTGNKTNWAVGIIAKSGSVTIQKLTFDNSAIAITAPDSITFNSVGSTNNNYTIAISMPRASINYSVCVEVIGRASKSKVGC